MTTTQRSPLVSAEEYLHGERDAPMRHEYVAGRVFAMTGGSVRHNRITGNLYTEIRARIGRSPCDIFVSDMKVQALEAYYYPDLMVVCDPADQDPYTKTRPVVVIEVASPTTRSIDEREKRLAYLSIPTLREYVLAEQDRAEVQILRRDDEGKWEEERIGANGSIRFASLDLVVPMQAVYEGVWR